MLYISNTVLVMQLPVQIYLSLYGTTQWDKKFDNNKSKYDVDWDVEVFMGLKFWTLSEMDPWKSIWNTRA